ncbi:DNA circularization protein [Pantoea sp. YU22]|uniref:DNA circularization protein n=1 Tax=Pantoea sp. YU22 TaxID=2497684 RepID=UPI000F86C777|nr:DNA circularization N-terminal domain-containing protein [Pantoea sp. YU22]RTY53636.1 DNA circularization protein [Pantoea sp. YU22]
MAIPGFDSVSGAVSDFKSALSTTPEWRKRLQKASFRGVQFEVDEEDGTFGRRVQVNEYPNRDKPFTEDLGRAARRINITAYLVGDDYPTRRDKLIKAVEQAGSGTLVHPYYGEMKGNIDGQVRVSHSAREGRICRISFAFVEAGELSFPTAGAATGKLLSGASAWLDTKINEMMSEFGLDGVSDFLQSGVISDAKAMFDTVTDAFQMVDSGIAAASRLLQGDLSVILSPPSLASDFVSSLQTMWRQGSKLSGDASGIVSMVKSLTGVTLDSGLAPRGKWSTDSGTTAARKTQTNLIAAAIRTTAISVAAEAVASLPAPKQTALAGQGAKTGAVTPGASAGQGGGGYIANVAHPALSFNEVSEAFGDASSSTSNSSAAATSGNDSSNIIGWDDLDSLRDSLNVAIDREQLRTADDGLFMALNNLRAAVNNDISSRLAQVEKIVERTPKEVLPALVLASDWYDDATREADITRRNSIRHPGFTPVSALKVPVK